ncbi:response regulator [Spirosoma agri]|uniref:Response regulator n=1 Tax=Spirosoma agri TaxID=1987381 RepID=A0A6M0IHQ8_9BACT|nr:response regulator [Spirosoma agri]NEU67806.1 response regulator [Spirosoma agri]
MSEPVNKPANQSKRKVSRVPLLIVEDNPDHWLIIRAALAQCFPEVEAIWVNHSAQALTYLNECVTTAGKLPRLILLDLYLPRREDGWALLETIKAHSSFQQLPVIALSSSQLPEDIIGSYSLGVSSFLNKPATYHQWLDLFYTFRRYWWELVSLPHTAR